MHFVFENAMCTGTLLPYSWFLKFLCQPCQLELHSIPRERTLPGHLRLGLNLTRNRYKYDGPHGYWELVAKGNEDLRSQHRLMELDQDG